MLLYDYKCKTCHYVIERLVKDNTVLSLDCERCGGKATRVIPAPRSKLDGTDPGFPDAYRKWADQHEKAGNPRIG